MIALPTTLRPPTTRSFIGIIIFRPAILLELGNGHFQKAGLRSNLLQPVPARWFVAHTIQRRERPPARSAESVADSRARSGPSGLQVRDPIFPSRGTRQEIPPCSVHPDLTGFPLQAYTGRVSTVETLSDDEKLGLLQGTLEVLVLRSLKLESNHAYGISQFLQHQSDSEFLVDNGSLYPALQRLLQRKWIAGQWRTSPNGRRARYYNLTPAGRKELLRATSKWERFAIAMAKILAPEG
jgi:PadR family transcriptional regulator, regulatory protein PadR